MKPPRLKETLPVRLTESVDAKISLISQATGLNKSQIVRMALNHGLPLLEAGKISFQKKTTAA